MTTPSRPPQQIFIIRHGEKPADDAANSEPPFGVDINGELNPHSLIHRQRGTSPRRCRTRRPRPRGIDLLGTSPHPMIAAAIPTADPAGIPALWPDDRFDVTWCFTLTPADPPHYVFSQVPQRLLPADTSQPIGPISPPVSSAADAAGDDAGIVS